MSKKISRRDFLKLGGLAALSAPAVNVIGKKGDDEIVESQAEFGGFAIRRRSKNDKPYIVDDQVYQRYDGRRPINPMKAQIQPENALMKMENKEPSYARYECALHSSAWTVAMGLGTNGAQTNAGLYSWDVIPNAFGPGSPKYFELPKWNPADDGLTTEDVTSIVKKAGLFYGASLVGVAPVDERWFYSKVIDMDITDLLGDAAAEFVEEAGYEMPEAGPTTGNPRLVVQNAMLAMEKGEMKDLILAATNNADPSILPDGLSPTAIKAIPAGMFQKMLPTVMQTFSNEYVHAMAVLVPTELYPAGFEVDSILEYEVVVVDMTEAIPAATINFHDGDKNYYDDSEGNGKYFISRKMKHVIVLAYEMDEAAIGSEHGMIPEAAVAMGYSRMAFTAGTLAQFIRDLGYNAIPMGNDTSLSVPIAIDAGLGELSRMGYLVTPKYGPRVRISKVLTDLPLIPDEPISFGVTEFCEICGACAEQCPSGAISPGERSFETPVNGNPGVFKWPVDGTKCQQFWTDSGVSCSICMGVCPFNKPEGWLHDATRILIGAKSGTIDKILLKLDQTSGYGEKMRLSPDEFWKKDTYVHIKS